VCVDEITLKLERNHPAGKRMAPEGAGRWKTGAISSPPLDEYFLSLGFPCNELETKSISPIFPIFLKVDL
jgi:hypothetical protein